MARHKDSNWNLPEGTPRPGNVTEHSWESIHAALLMDIRDELKRLNNLLHCPNFQQIPFKLDAIRCNTAKPRKQKAKA
jgi:histidinol phosphatase-like enzyme